MTVLEQIDVCVESPKKHNAWKKVGKFPYRHNRDLPVTVAQHAIDYISALVKGYPFQLQYAMALPLWKRFAQSWCDTGDESIALRDI